jgi:hypothetical protein
MTTATSTCKDCRYHQGPQIGPDNRRECRAQPPSMGREVQHLASHPVTLASWPLTLPWDYCGAFEAIPAPPAPAPAPTPAAGWHEPPPVKPEVKPLPVPKAAPKPKVESP